MLEVSNFTVKSALSVCDLETSSFYITIMLLGSGPASKLGMISQIPFEETQLKLRFKVSTEKLSTFSR